MNNINITEYSFVFVKLCMLTTHCESEKSERIEKNQSCPNIRISHKQLLAKNFAGVESGLYETRRFHPLSLVFTSDINISKIAKDKFSSEFYEDKAERIFF